MRALLLSSRKTLHDCNAQLLLPSVLLLPLFILVIYLLVEVTKVSIAKVRHQFALDAAAYAQMSSVSTFLNANGVLNGPLVYRVLSTYDDKLTVVAPDQPGGKYRGKDNWTVFDLFFQAGAVPTVAPDYDMKARLNPPPNPDSVDWGVHYAKYEGIADEKDEDGKPMYDRSGWEKENPEPIKGRVHLMNKEMVDKHYVSAHMAEGLPAIKGYLFAYIQVGDTFILQKDLYEKVIKNAAMFREGYFLNVDDCKRNECARQSAARLLPFLTIPIKYQEADDLMVYLSRSDGRTGGSGGAIDIPLTMTEMGAKPLIFFSYVTPAGRSKLRTLKRGILLKQSFKLPTNHFNINLESKYKPFVRNTVVLSCPRANNNCVWPNPLPKYGVILKP